MDFALPAEPHSRARMLSSEDLDWALARGWDDFKSKRGDILLLPIIYVVGGLVAAWFAFNADLFRLLFPLVAGFALVGPAAAAGFYEIARRREAGVDTSWWHFLDPLKSRALVPLATLTVMLAAIFLVWLGTADALYRMTLGRLAPDSPAAFLTGLFGTPEGWTLILIGNAVGALIATLTLAVAAISFPMVVDRPVDAATAVATSLRVFARNPMTMLNWGIRVGVILALAALPLLVGLIVALPVLGYATWHLYTRAVQR
jgi:uncharacterized membrane protein